jgi:hypothetical protein
MYNQNLNLENEDEIIQKLQEEIQKNNVLIEIEKQKLKTTTTIVKVIYIIIGLWMLCCVGSCVINNISENTSNSGCME